MAAPTEAQVDRVIAGINDAEINSDYADTIVFEPGTNPVEGTRYKYILTSAADPRE